MNKYFLRKVPLNIKLLNPFSGFNKSIKSLSTKTDLAPPKEGEVII